MENIDYESVRDLRSVQGKTFYNIWPNLNGGECKWCGVHIDESEGIFLSDTAFPKRLAGRYCVECYISNKTPAPDIIERCE